MCFSTADAQLSVGVVAPGSAPESALTETVRRATLQAAQNLAPVHARFRLRFSKALIRKPAPRGKFGVTGVRNFRQRKIDVLLDSGRSTVRWRCCARLCP